MSKWSLEEVFYNQIKQMIVTLIIILIVTISLTLFITYNRIFEKEKREVQYSINYVFNNFINELEGIKKKYSKQLRQSLVVFYQGYDDIDNKQYINQKVKSIKEQIKNLEGNQYQIDQINYSFINHQGIVFDTDYSLDKNLNLSNKNNLWNRLQYLKSGKILLMSLDDKVLTTKFGLTAYIKLDDGNIFKLSILFKNINGLFKKEFNKIKQENEMKFYLFNYNLDSLFNSNIKLTTKDKKLLKKSVKKDQVIGQQLSLFTNKYYQSLSSDYDKLYCLVKVEHTNLKIIFSLLLTSLVAIIMTWFIFWVKIRKKISQIIKSISNIVIDMDYFQINREHKLNLGQTNIKEIDDVINSYQNMADQVNFNYQQLIKYYKKINKHKKKLRKIINLVPNHIFIKDSNGKFILVNSTHADFFDLTVSEMEGKCEQEVHSLKEEINKFLADDQEVIATNSKKTIKQVVTNPQGKKRIFEVVKIPFIEEGKNYVLAVGQDITTRIETKEQIEKQKEELIANCQRLKVYNEENQILNRTLKLAYKKQEELITKLEELINLTSQLSQETLVDEEAFLTQLFQSIFEVVEEADYGSVYLFEDGQIKFIDAIGHDLNILEQLKLDSHIFTISTDKAKIIDNISDLSATKMKLKTRNKFLEATKSTKQSITFILKIEGKKKAGISLDIAESSTTEFDNQTKELVEAFKNLAASFYTIQEYTQIKNKFQREIVISMVSMLEVHDKYTKGHSENVARLATKVAQQMNLSETEITDAYWAGMLHDIGKTVISKNILTKTSHLSTEEYKEIKKHPVWGYNVLKNSEQLKKIASYIYYHHERYDGKGYPSGLQGTGIPLISRIITVVDAWDAMRSNRSYRQALSKEYALTEIKANKGTQFDPQVVEAFLKVVNG